MELRQLKYFMVVYEEGSVTKAAQRLNVVQPALSQQVSKLEEELGQKLFIRTRKGMVPTEAGHEAYALYSAVIRDIELARQKLEDSKGQVRGDVAIGAVLSIAYSVLGETIASFNAKYPEVRVQVKVGHIAYLNEMLRTSQLDLIVINVPPQASDPNITDIVKEDLVLVCAANTSVNFDIPVDVSTISNLKMVIPSRSHGLRLIIDDAVAKQNKVLVPHMEFDELKTIEDFVGCSDFFGILPPISVHNALRSGFLKAFPIAPAIGRRMVYISSATRPLSVAAQLLADDIRRNVIDFSHDTTGKLESHS